MDCSINIKRSWKLIASVSLACLATVATCQLQAAEILPPMLADAAQQQAAQSTVQAVGYNAGCDSCAPAGCGLAGCTDHSCAGGDACCGSCYQPCHSFWTARLNALYMQRDRPDDLVLAQDTDSVNPSRTLNARDFEFDYQAGYDLALIAQPECGTGLEIRFMSLQDVSANTTATVDTDMANPLQINNANIPPTFVQDVEQIIGAYDTEFYSLEMNLRQQFSTNLTLLLGFRYLELDEQLVLDLDGSAPASIYSTTTQNRLYGVQVGAEGTLTRCNRFRLDGVAKGGLYYNAASHSTFLNNGVINQPALGTDDELAFVGELGLFGVYDINPCWSIRAGYQGLWFEDVALASDQIPASNLFTQTGIDSEGGTFYHGGVLGLEFRR